MGDFERGKGAREGKLRDWKVAVARGGMRGSIGGMKRPPDKRSKLAPPLPEGERAWGAFWALGDGGRWAVAGLLAAHRALTVTEAARLSGVAERSVSRHFLELWRAGLVSREAPADDGRERFFRLTYTGEGLVQAGMLLEG